MAGEEVVTPVHVAVLAFKGVSLFQLSSPAVAFGVVSGLLDLPPYEVRYCAQRPGRLRSDQGLVIEVADGLEALREADVIVVPEWGDPEVASLVELTDELRQVYARVH